MTNAETTLLETFTGITGAQVRDACLAIAALGLGREARYVRVGRVVRHCSTFADRSLSMAAGSFQAFGEDGVTFKALA